MATIALRGSKACLGEATVAPYEGNRGIGWDVVSGANRRENKEGKGRELCYEQESNQRAPDAMHDLDFSH